ncbi:MAG: RDD family protein [Bacilli bacterium]|nr:RDD family protein [Bacilli bacterium]
MNSKIIKRMFAYFIDIMIILFVIGIIVNAKEKDKTVMQLRSDIQIVNELYANGEIKFQEYFDRWTVINHQIDQECVIYFIFNILLILVYFVLLPYVWNGQTFGKKLLKLQVVSNNGEKVTIVQYLIRNMLLNGLAQVILLLLFLYLLPSSMYFIFSSILTFIQLILVIISVFMILYRKDKRGLHDILSSTKVITVS